LKAWKVYQHPDRYKRAVTDLNRVLEMVTLSKGARLGLANFDQSGISPARSEDLIRAAENPETNPVYPYFKNRLLDVLKREVPSVVGFSLNYLSQAVCTFAMMGFLRRECPGLTLVLGGGLVTSWMRRPGWQNPFRGLVDHLVAGPGERALLCIMGETGGVRGEAVGQGIQEHYTPNYDSLPTTDYLSPGSILPYSASSGCYWNKCSFCPERAERNPYVPVPANTVLADLQHLVRKQKPVLIHLVDNAVSPALLKAICSNPLGAPWYGFTRITSQLTDLDFCMALKRSGCVMLKLGLESGDQEVLEVMQKGIDLEEASSALTTLKKAGIATYVYLLFGTPPESLPQARATLDFLTRHRDKIDFLNVAIFNLLIDGPDVLKFKTKPFYEGDLSLYVDFEHPKGWSRKLVRQFLDKELKRHPAIAPILRRDPPVFTSNHAPLFVMD